MMAVVKRSAPYSSIGEFPAQKFDPVSIKKPVVKNNDLYNTEKKILWIWTNFPGFFC